jgi:3-oxoacyl-[acyl-carrier protein] reductase
MTDLAGRVALVTGGSGGIGQALVGRLLTAGASVAVHYGNSAEAAEAIVRAAQARGQRAISVQADLGRAEAAEDLVDTVEQQLGGIDLLLANHGAGRRSASLDEITAEDWDRTMAVNTRSTFLLTRRTLPGMRERGFGRILYTSSVAGLTGGIVGADYAASKAALHGLMHYVAAHVAAEGITVNALAPALITDTGMLPGDPGELAARIPVRRLGTPDEVADIALAVLRNGYLTNQVISVDGGMTAR